MRKPLIVVLPLALLRYRRGRWNEFSLWSPSPPGR